MKLEVPDDTQRHVIIGTTGSGKTQAGLWHLSIRNYDVKPWVIYDFKGEGLIADIQDMAFETDLYADAPTQPGIYVCHAGPNQENAISDHMNKIWAEGNCGVYIDEGYMVGNNNPGFRNLLTQGRSLHIPMITLSQRPVWMDRFSFSEAEFIQVFDLSYLGDLKKVSEYIPRQYSKEEKKRIQFWEWAIEDDNVLKRYHSYYYIKPERRLMKLNPVPDQDAILFNFESKLRRLKKVV